MSAQQRQAARTSLRDRLESRRSEIEQAILTRLYAISDPTGVPDPQYADGLRAAVAAALDFAFAGIESGEHRVPAPPVALLAQARLASRNGISLDTVLRRYFAAYAILTDFAIDEADRDGLLRGPTLKSQLRMGAAVFDRLVSAVTEEHVREGAGRLVTSEQVRAELVERLLDGELIDKSQLQYDFDGLHIGIVASGPGAQEAIRKLAASLDRRLLVVSRPEGLVWAWLGGRRPVNPSQVHLLLASSSFPTGIRLAFGEPNKGLPGWRMTHRQATAALPIAQRREEPVVRYADVAPLASALQDDLLAGSLHDLYLAPLERDRDGGEAARETLRAYFAAGRNVSSTAAVLGVSRQAVNSRLRTIEGRIGRRIDHCVGELETALGMERLNSSDSFDR